MEEPEIRRISAVRPLAGFEKAGSGAGKKARNHRRNAGQPVKVNAFVSASQNRGIWSPALTHDRSSFPELESACTCPRCQLLKLAVALRGSRGGFLGSRRTPMSAMAIFRQIAANPFWHRQPESRCTKDDLEMTLPILPDPCQRRSHQANRVDTNRGFVLGG